MADPRIIDVALDERTILWRSADVEQERRIAIFDLIEGNHFAPARQHPDGYAGPYRIALSVEEGRLALHIKRDDDTPLETLVLALGGGVVLAAAGRPGPLAAVVAAYTAGVTAATVQVRRAHGSDPAPVDGSCLAGAFVAMHLSWGLGFVEGLVARRAPAASSAR